MNFTGKTVVVTGGRRGIGRAIALAFQEAGAEVIVIAKSKNRGALPESIGYVQVDLSQPKSRIACMEGWRSPDILVNNAGISHTYSALDYPMEEWAKILEVNLSAVFDLSCQAVRLGCKRIINIASISAFNGARNIVGYASAKHALLGMTKCLSNEWAPMGVTVNCVAPGFIETDMLQLKDPQTVIGRIPVGRLGKSKDVVGAVLFLASDEASYITGTTIVVDGGWCAR